MQQRVSNTANEIATIAPTVGATWPTPAYDRNGNMNSIPEGNPPTTLYAARFDAWNRLSILGSTTSYGYDGLHRRVFSLVSGSLRCFIHSSQWQVLEEYLSLVIDRRYVWGIRYVDDLVLRDRDLTSTLERFYALQDANWNVVAIYGVTAAAVEERYAYTAYGVCQFLNASFGVLGESAYDWTVLFTGRVLDDESGAYYYRMRYYHPGLGAFLGRDPTAAGPNLFQYCDSEPLSLIDPFGLQQAHPNEKLIAATPRVASVAWRFTYVYNWKGVGFRWGLILIKPSAKGSSVLTSS